MCGLLVQELSTELRSRVAREPEQHRSVAWSGLAASVAAAPSVPNHVPDLASVRLVGDMHKVYQLARLHRCDIWQLRPHTSVPCAKGTSLAG